MKLVREQYSPNGTIHAFPDRDEYLMLDRAERDSLTIEVYQGNTLIGHMHEWRFTPLPQAQIDWEDMAPSIWTYVPDLLLEYIQRQPGMFWEYKATLIEENELSLLVNLLNDSLIEGMNIGLLDSHPSQVFKQVLTQKLLRYLRKPLVLLSEPPERIVERWRGYKRRKEER